MDAYYNPQTEDLILVVENTGTAQEIARILKTMPGFEDVKVLIISVSRIIIKSVGSEWVLTGFRVGSEWVRTGFRVRSDSFRRLFKLMQFFCMLVFI